MTRPNWLRQLRNRWSSRLGVESLEAREVPAGFNFTDFSDVSDLSLLGSTAVTPGNVLQLTPAVGGQNGAAWYTEESQFVGLAFETTFQFQLHVDGGAPVEGSDGFVFLIQNTAPTYLAGGGGTLGYDGLKNSLAVEFDTFQNSEVNDPSPSHISVHTNGTGANSWAESLSLGSYNTSPVLDNGAVRTARISYSPGTLSIYLDNMTTPKLTVAVNLAEKLNLEAGKAWVGFTAATGGGFQNHDILNWSYSVLSDVTTTLSVSDTSALEGNAGPAAVVFTVTREGDTSATSTVNWATANRTATAGSDYTAASGQVTFGPGETQRTITVFATGDTATEAHETFALQLTGITGGTLADGVGTGTILNDDVTVSISDASASEGDVSNQPLGAFVASPNPYAMILGPDGNLYVGDISASAVYRYDAAGSPRPAPGKPGAEFVSPGSGGLNFVRDIAFGPDGFLYAVSARTASVLRFDPITGAFQGELVTAGAGGLDAPRGLTFRNGYLFVTSVGVDPGTPAAGTDSVLRYDAVTGAPAGVSGLPGDAVFIASGSGGLDNPSRLVFGPDGMAYVSSTATTEFSATANSVLRFDGATGSPAGISGQPGNAIFVSPGSGGLDGPVAMVFRPDGLYVTSWRNSAVFRYQTSTGAFAGAVIPAGAGGASGVFDLLFEPDGNLLFTSKDTNQVLRYGAASQAVLTVSLNSASGVPVTISYATANGTAAAGSDYTATSGTLTFAPGQTSRTILVSTLDDAVLEARETFSVMLSNPTGAVIADGTGVGSIADNDNKFFVVNDATVNQTYEYGSTGTTGESYGLAAGNAAPRGAASNPAGDKVWVVDANNGVYVYNSGGGLLGSWTALAMKQPEGIAVFGNDIWIVDAKHDRVFRWIDGASRLSGQAYVSSGELFDLANGNKEPRGLVTDGTHIWVVNDAATDKVFKYTMAGALVGSWTITSGGGTPTGITLDPTNAAHLWIVDSGTDRVYQFDNAVGRTSGSQPPSVSFALAAGNTNPQDIADPPVSTDGGGDWGVWVDGPTPSEPKTARPTHPVAAPRTSAWFFAPVWGDDDATWSTGPRRLR